MTLLAPFPYFGGKRSVAPDIWKRLGSPAQYIEPSAVFLDPPYRSYEKLYGDVTPVADAVEAWARKNAHLRIALCGHRDDYDLPGWDVVNWSRGRLTYSGSKTTDSEAVWYSPACLPRVSRDLFADLRA